MEQKINKKCGFSCYASARVTLAPIYPTTGYPPPTQIDWGSNPGGYKSLKKDENVEEEEEENETLKISGFQLGGALIGYLYLCLIHEIL